MNEQTETLNQSMPASLAAKEVPAEAPRRAGNMIAPQDNGGSFSGPVPDSGTT
jgi:hypothetical protein